MAMKTKGLGDLLAGNIVFRSLNIACTILITFLLTRAMGAGGFGLLSLMIANAALLNLLTCLGAESGITYHYSSGSLPAHSLISITYVVIFIQLIIFLAVEAIWHFYTGSFLPADEGNGIEVLPGGLLYFFSIVTIDKYQAFFNASHQYNQPIRIMLAVNFLSLLAYAFFYFGTKDAQPAIFAKIYILGSVIQALLMMSLFHYSVKQPVKFTAIKRDEWTRFFSYSSIVLITNIIQFLAYRIDYWLIDHYRDAEQLGFYSLAVRLGQMLWILPLLMAGIFFPRMAGNAGEEEERKWLALIRVTNLFFLLVAVIAGSVSFWAIPFFAGASFAGSVIPFIYLLPGLLFFCFNIVFAAYFAGKGKLTINLAGSALCLLLVLAGDLLLIPRFGIKGAAIASTVAYTAAGIHHLLQFVRLKKIPLRSVLIISRNDRHTIINYLKKHTARK